MNLSVLYLVYANNIDASGGDGMYNDGWGK